MKRRRFLRGLGVAVALPPLESLYASGARAAAGGANSPASRGAGGGPAPGGPADPAATSTGAPLRMAFVYFPNGAIQPTWWPTGEDKTFELARTMQPLAKLKQKILILGGLDHVNATPGPDGAGDHARASGSFLTGVRVKKTAGSDIRAGISIDQVAANQVGHLTRFPSLELTCDAVRKSGNCDSGYSCAYQYNLAWRSPSTPVAPEPNPRLLFERLFGAGPHGQRQASLERRQRQQRSILDFVVDDARRLTAGLSRRDEQKLGEYLTSVREIETRIQRAERFGKAPDPDVPTPEGIPASFEDYIRVMFDMLVLAFQTDSTRIATFLLANEGSNRAFPEINIAEGHHYLTHHQNKQEMIDKVAEIDLFYMRQFARFLESLDATKDADGRSLLDNSMIVYGSGNSDGNRHTHTNLPIVLAGGGGGTLRPGRFLKLADTPMSNLLLSLADRLGVQGVERHGDSNGRVAAI
jgi:hypothetical protein